MKHRLTFLFTGLLWLLVLSPSCAQRRMENLGRGVVAVRTGTNVFVSWRLLGLDPTGLGFNLYRTTNGSTPVKLNSAVLTAGTNYTDNTANLAAANAYYVKPVLNGVEQAASGAYTLAPNTAAKPCFTVPLRPGNKMHFAWVGDLDGDGEYDYVVDRKGGTPVRSTIEAYKRDGTFLWEVNYGPNSENDDNIEPGSSSIGTGNWDGVTVYDLDGDGKAEVISKIANGVILGNGAVFTDASNDKQWIAVLDGQTGALKSTVAVPQDYISDGPMASSLGIGYLDGTTPSIIAKFKNRQSRVAGNGFNMMICASKFTGTTTSMQWQWNRGTSGEADGHQIRIADVDQNGTDEILDIGFCLNSNGTLRYSLKDQGIIHGDRTQIGKLDPNRPGLQGYGVQQNNASFLYEYYFDANTGEVLWKHFGSQVGDVGRGAAGDIDPRYSGVEVWAFDGVHNGPSNTRLTTTSYPYPNFRIWWDGDLLAENLHNEMIDKWNYATSRSARLVTAYRFDNANAGDRDAPLFYGDILGDWREEVIFASSDNSKLVVFTTDNATSTRLYTLAHNPAYRNGMTIKGYMQSHWTDYFLGDGMVTPPAPNITYAPAAVALDTTPPTILAAGFVANLLNGTRTIEAADVDYGSHDSGSGIASMRISPSTFTCANIGPNQVTLTVTDSTGNVATQAVTVTIVDNTPPVVLAAGLQVRLLNGTSTLEAADVDYGSTDDCGIVSMTLSPRTFTCANVGPNEVTLTVTDNSGNVAIQKVTVDVLSDGTCTSLASRNNQAATGVDFSDGERLQAYPNPVAEQATVAFRPTQTGRAQVKIYNQLGMLVTTLFDGAVEAQRIYSLTLDGRPLPSGIYNCQLVTNGQTVSKRLVVSK